jgi:hypothetical protein
MASLVNAALGAIAAAAFWILLGYAVSRRVFPLALALGAAAALGWAVHSAATLPLLTLIGFSPLAVAGTGALCAIAAGASLMARAAEPTAEAIHPRVRRRGRRERCPRHRAKIWSRCRSPPSPSWAASWQVMGHRNSRLPEVGQKTNLIVDGCIIK